MKKVSCLIGAALVVASPAFAADLAVKAPVYKAPPAYYSWTGCYAGGDAGVGFHQQSTSITPVNENQAAVSGNISDDTAIGGGFVGCNYQFSPWWVAGVEGDITAGTFGGSTTGPNLFPNGKSAGSGSIFWGASSSDWVASARARLGYVPAPNALLYATGGAAWTRTNYSGHDQFNNPTFLATSFSDSRTGWVAGAGLEFAPWSNNWLFRIEYLHYQFSGASSTVGSPASNVTFSFGDLKIDTVRAGVGYKF